jgi:transcriptional regulator with XRE-family HTH domain
MTRVSKIAASPPDEVARALARLGANIRTARIRRRWTIAQLAERVGVSRMAMGAVEHGKATSAIAPYLGALWALGLLDQMRSVGDPDLDVEGRALESARSPRAAPKRRTLYEDV